MTQPAVDHLTNEQGEELQALSAGQINALCEKAKTDLFFLAKGILGYRQVEQRAHAALCNFIVNCTSKRRLVLMPRGHLKTTICTISDSIRLALRDPAETRILIQNETSTNAEDMLYELKAHWTSGGLLPMLFPELVPAKTSGPGSDWSSIAASINRTTHWNESTWTASGSEGSPQSKHFTHLKCDDLIGEKHKNSEVEMQKAIRWTDAMEPLLDNLDDQIDLYGTRKTVSDVYAHVMDKYFDEIAIFSREPIEGGVPIFSKYSLKRLMQIMVRTPDVWAYDFMNNPIGKGGIDWGQEALRYFELDEKRQQVRLIHHLTGRLTVYDWSELDIVVTADPNGGEPLAPDKAAVTVHGVTPDDGILVLESEADRWSPDGHVDRIWEACQKWHPRVVGIERQGPSSTVFYFEKKCIEEGLYYNTKPLIHSRESKAERIRGMLDTPIKARRLYIQRHMLGLASKLSYFPQINKHQWDELDCLSFGPEIYRRGVSQEDLKEAEEAEAKVLAFRGVTGYGESV